MSKKKKEISRRKALGWVGKGVAAATVAGTITTSAEEVQAQSSTETLDFQIKYYRAFMPSAPQYGWSAQIILQDETRTKQCSVLFWKDEDNIPANTVEPGALNGKLHYPASRLMEIREFIRNERPIGVTIVGGNGIGTIANWNDEKPGDHDLRLSRLLNNSSQ